MFGFMVTADGGLTTAGYVITVIAGIILFFLAIYFAGKNSDKKKLTTRQLVFCAVAIALAFITSYLKIFKLPWGGSVTLCSMLFIVLIANWYGGRNWYYGWVCLRNPAVYPGALYTFIFSGVL